VTRSSSDWQPAIELTGNDLAFHIAAGHRPALRSKIFRTSLILFSPKRRFMADVMNANKYFVAAIVSGAVILTFASYAFRQRTVDNHERGSMALSGSAGRFGPTIETIVPAAKKEGDLEILNLETGRAMLQPPLEHFNSRAEDIMAWVKSNGLDISCSAWSGGGVCVTYNMLVVAVDGKNWDQITEAELAGNPALDAGQNSPRRMLVLGQNRPDTYAFRTCEGTLGMLQLGLSQNGKTVNIRYKLIHPAESLAVANRFAVSNRMQVSTPSL
jgi:hypothetical protein